MTTSKLSIFRFCNQYSTYSFAGFLARQRPCKTINYPAYKLRTILPGRPLCGQPLQDARGTRISVHLSEIGCCERFSVTDTFSFLAGGNNLKLLLQATTPSHQKVTVHPLSSWFTVLIRIGCQHRVTVTF